MTMSTVSRDLILEILADVKDPELPMIDVVELGIVRGVSFESDQLIVDVTPTYSGCPAMQVIEREIVHMLESHGFDDVRVRTIYSPAWSTEWMTEEARERLRSHGIAPPDPTGNAAEPAGIAELVSLRRAKPPVECPYCGSSNTQTRSEFGSTACKSIHFCASCNQPFDYFKAF